MRLISSLFAALIALLALTGCGTKTGLVLPPPQKASANSAVLPSSTLASESLHISPMADNSLRAMESRL